MTSTPIDLSSPTFMVDPYPVYHQLLETEPVYKASMSGAATDVWLITRYADVAALLKEAHFANDMSRVLPADQRPTLSGSLIFSDPPDHTRLRSLVNQAFTPKRVKDLEPRIAEIADDLLARVRPRGAMDFVADFASILPVVVIAELLGVRPEDRPQFEQWTNTIALGADRLRATAQDRQASRDAGMALGGYFRGMFDERRERPQADFLTGLLEAREVHDRLSEQELLQTSSLLLLAGYETTVRLLGNGLYTLLRHPDQLDLLRQRPALLPSAIEEMLRYECPVQQVTMRAATGPVELAGRRFDTGEMLIGVIGAANRDPREFPNPDRFDIQRSPNRHLGFGFGIHFCLGAPLARLEARVAFSRLLEQMPDLRLVKPEPDWQPNMNVRGLRSLAVTF